MSDAAKTVRSAFRAGTVAVLLLTTGACYKHTYTIGAGAPGGALMHDEWRHHWLWGLVNPDRELALRDVCPSGNATIDMEMSFLNGLVSALTSGIYSPTTVQVRCADQEAAIDLDAADVARIVRHPTFLSWVGAVLPDRLQEAASAQGEFLVE